MMSSLLFIACLYSISSFPLPTFSALLIRSRLILRQAVQFLFHSYPTHTFPPSSP